MTHPPRRAFALVLVVLCGLALAGCTGRAGSAKDVHERLTLGPAGGVSAVTQVKFSSMIGGNLHVSVNATGGPVDAGLQTDASCGAFLDSNPPSYFPDSRYGSSNIQFDYYVKRGDYCLALENKNGNPVDVDVVVKLPR